MMARPYAWVAAAALALLAGCASAPPPAQVSQPAGSKPACGVGSDARGIAVGFFAFFQDRPECF